MDYWQECVAEALEDAGIGATKEQIETVTSWVEGAHENYGMAHGHECIPNPLVQENESLKREIIKERDKVICDNCNGRGRIVTQGPHHSSDSECYKCRGEGRVSL